MEKEQFVEIMTNVEIMASLFFKSGKITPEEYSLIKEEIHKKILEYAALEHNSDHENWFREQVEAGLSEALNPTTSLISHEEVISDVFMRIKP